MGTHDEPIRAGQRRVAAQQDADEQIGALKRLELAGWEAVVLGNPSSPHSMVYTRHTPAYVDSVLVSPELDAEGTRKSVLGSVLRKTDGRTCVEVVEEVLSW